MIGYGGYLALHHELTAGMLIRFLGYVVILYGPIRRFAELNTTYQSSLSAMRRALGVLEIKPSVVEAPRPRTDSPKHGEIRLEHVFFRFERVRDSFPRLERDVLRESAPDSRWVLEDVTLRVAAGERLAIVGQSGAGKTTLASLIPRLYDPAQGRILVDGVDLRDYSLRALRSAIAIVQQDSFIFSGTVRENIAYGRPDATEKEVWAAAHAAHADEFISRFKDGYSTILEDHGRRRWQSVRRRRWIAAAWTYGSTQDTSM